MPQTPPNSINSATPSPAHVVLLRAALQDARAVHDAAPDAQADPAEAAAHKKRFRAAQQAVDAASRPLIALVSRELSWYCAQLARQIGKHEPFDGDDLAQEAWTNALEHLQGETGSRVRDDAHFKRLLRKCALRLYLNLRRKKGAQISLDAPSPSGGDTFGEQTAAPLVLPDVLWFTQQSAWSEWLVVLFNGTPTAFRGACKMPPRRRPVVYQAFVLIGIAGFLRVLQDQTGARAQFGESVLRELTGHLSIPPPFWEIIEQAVRAAPPMDENYDKTRDAGVCEAVKQSICAALNVPEISQTFFHVLRNEASKLAMGG